MFGFDFKFEDNTAAVAKAAQRESAKAIGRAAGRIRKTAIASISRGQEASAPGSPPNTRRGQLKRAIRFDVNRESLEAVIGPMESMVGTSAAAHEFGEEYKGQDYPERPFMGPALDDNITAFAEEFSGTIGE